MIDVLGVLANSDVSGESSVLLSYELDLAIYDGWVRRRLAVAGVTNQVVFCDLGVYERELVGLSAARHFGRGYSVTPVREGEAFHPKVYLILGRRRGRLVVGSGNATSGGLLRNAELFGVFDYDGSADGGSHPAFQSIVGLAQELAERAPELVKRQIAKAVALAPWLNRPPKEDGRTLLIAGPGRRSLLEQITMLLDGRKVESVVLLSSSFDHRLEGVARLARLTHGGNVRCIVQPRAIEIDGNAVRRLGGRVQWHPFIDPYPKEKKKRKDVRAHAKLIVFACRDRELVVYGSANASRPALLSDRGNTEVAVAFWAGKNITVRQLGLEKSLRAARIEGLLFEKRLVSKTEDDVAPGYACMLAGAVVGPQRIDLTVIGSVPTREFMLEVTESVHGPIVATLPVGRGDTGGFVALGRVPEASRVVRLCDRDGAALSNLAGLTYPEVAEGRSRSGLSARAEAALAAMQDGTVLGTVLFELLNQYRDFDVVMARPPRRSARTDGGQAAEERDDTRTSESFYTDATSEEMAAGGWIGDRADLDLLASLVEPLRAQSEHKELQGLEVEEDDSAIEEEAERREIDAKGGRARGEERQPAGRFASREALERATRRLAARLDRSAASVERALDARERLKTVPVAGIVRQVWMTHIAAFLTERITLSVDGDEVRCLEARCFARFVLRVCRALGGGRDGGLLSLPSPEVWSGPDGETLRRGLAFLWTCCLWATAFVRANPAGEAEDVWDQAPELIGARFTKAIQVHCRDPDTRDLARRLPACGRTDVLKTWERRALREAALIGEIESERLKDGVLRRDAAAAEPGSLVFHPTVGVTVLVGRDAQPTYRVLDLSRGSKAERKFVAGVVEVQAEGWPVPWLRRTHESATSG